MVIRTRDATLARRLRWPNRTGSRAATRPILVLVIPQGHDRESAILITLPVDHGSYTATVRGVNDTTGVGLVEGYFGNPRLGASCP